MPMTSAPDASADALGHSRPGPGAPERPGVAMSAALVDAAAAHLAAGAEWAAAVVRANPDAGPDPRLIDLAAAGLRQPGVRIESAQHSARQLLAEIGHADAGRARCRRGRRRFGLV